MGNSEMMQDRSMIIKLRTMQWAIWVIFYCFLLLYTMQKWDRPAFGFRATSIAVIFYLLAVYLNASWLIPRFYKQKKIWQYVLFSAFTLLILLTGRMWLEFQVLKPLHLSFYGLTLPHFSFVFITNFLAFAFGALLRISIDYLSLLKKEEEWRLLQVKTELSLLKAQVQPHFLFNTLNNIYYLAYTRSDRTAEVIAKLSDIMRYFVDEAPREKVSIAKEIQFLQNYMELEQIRMLHPMKIDFRLEYAEESLMIPPMLLIPLVENVFKHGIDKTREDNFASISLFQDNGYLCLQVINRQLPAGEGTINGSGFINLRKRLAMLFPGNASLTAGVEGENYSAVLKFPV